MPSDAFRGLDPERVAATIDRLCRRVEVRFPDSGLARVCRDLDRIASHARERIAWIRRPNLALRTAVALLIVVIVGGVAATVATVRVPREPLQLLEFVQAVESGINDVVFVGVALVFLLTVERRIKRRRALEALQELRSVAHIIDMHQLTKDPEWVLGRGNETGLLPPRNMTRFELSRYLDYCSEALSLTGKVAALYAEGLDDDVVLEAVNDVEDLTTGLSRKIWQKLMVLFDAGPGADLRSGLPSEPA